MKKLIVLATVISLISANSFANQAVDLNKNDPAPYTGVLLDKEKANEVKNELIEKDGLSKTNDSLTKTIDLQGKNLDYLNQKNDLIMNQNLNLTKELNDVRETSNLTKALYFLGGVVITGAAVWGASRLAR